MNLESENLRGINTNSDDEFYLKEIKDKCKLEDYL